MYLPRFWPSCATDIDKLDNIVDKYKNTYKTIKWNLSMLIWEWYIEYDFAHKFPNPNHKDPKFKFNDDLRISKYKSMAPKSGIPKSTAPWTCIINDHNGEGIAGTFYEKEYQKRNKRFKIKV